MYQVAINRLALTYHSSGAKKHFKMSWYHKHIPPTGAETEVSHSMNSNTYFSLNSISNLRRSAKYSSLNDGRR